MPYFLGIDIICPDVIKNWAISSSQLSVKLHSRISSDNFLTKCLFGALPIFSSIFSVVPATINATHLNIMPMLRNRDDAYICAIHVTFREHIPCVFTIPSVKVAQRTSLHLLFNNLLVARHGSSHWLSGRDHFWLFPQWVRSFPTGSPL